MASGWHLYRFDYAGYLALRPALRSATTATALAAIAENAAAQAIVESVENDEITLDEARHGWLLATCCLGDPLPLDKTFPRFVGALGRKRGAEDAAELLCELAAGGKNLEAWLLPSYGIVGFLTPDETLRLAQSYAPLAKSGRLRVGGKQKRRRGGLMGKIGSFFRHLLDSSPQVEEMLPLLAEVIEEAVQNGEGIVVVSA